MSNRLGITDPDIRALLEVAAAFFFNGYCTTFSFSNSLYMRMYNYKPPINMIHIKICPKELNQKTFDALSALCEEARIVTYTIPSSRLEVGSSVIILHMENAFVGEQENSVDPVQFAE